MADNNYNPYNSNNNNYNNNYNGNYNGNIYNSYYDTTDGYSQSYESQPVYANTETTRKALTLSFVYMAIALAVSGITAVLAYAMGFLESGTGMTIFYVSFLVEIGVVFAANGALAKRNSGLAKILFFVYAMINGMTLASIFYAYDMTSILCIFFATAALFGAIAVFAIVTKKDLTVLGIIGYMGLFGMIIASIVLIITGSFEPALLTVIGLALFIGITAYDVQKIKAYANESDSINTVAVYGALNLYLDFINLFLKLLRLFAKRN